MMWETIIAAAITGVVSLVGMIVAFRTNTKTQTNEMDKKMAVIDERINNLTEEVKRHNNYAIRMPVVEQRLDALEDRVSRLERN